jgi:hypothetical protein
MRRPTRSRPDYRISPPTPVDALIRELEGDLEYLRKHTEMSWQSWVQAWNDIVIVKRRLERLKNEQRRIKRNV